MERNEDAGAVSLVSQSRCVWQIRGELARGVASSELNCTIGSWRGLKAASLAEASGATMDVLHRLGLGWNPAPTGTGLMRNLAAIHVTIREGTTEI